MRTLLMPLLTALAGMTTACTPANDWRELRPEDSGIIVSFPCKPDRHARTVTLVGRATRMEMLVCTVDGATYALAFADIGDPAAVTPALDELRVAATSNLGAMASSEQGLAVPGMTPNARSARLRFEGRRPDGVVLQEQAAFFVRGLRVFQATILAPTIADGASESFFGGLRLAT